MPQSSNVYSLFHENQLKKLGNRTPEVASSTFVDFCKPPKNYMRKNESYILNRGKLAISSLNKTQSSEGINLKSEPHKGKCKCQSKTILYFRINFPQASPKRSDKHIASPLNMHSSTYLSQSRLQDISEINNFLSVVSKRLLRMK